MTVMQPVIFQWDGEVMVPLKRFGELCNAQYIVGECYPLAPHDQRSGKTHRHYFACIQEAFINLPEDAPRRFASSEHLRKWALIKAGYRDERVYPCASNEEAERLRAFILPMDEFAVVAVYENTVIVLTAQSQSMKAMGRQVFQESKQKVLELLADMIGVTVEALAANAKQHLCIQRPVGKRRAA